MPRGTAAILRDYDAPRRAALAARLVAICRRRGVLFLVAGDAELARAVGADGVHLSARSSRPPLSRTPGLLTVSCHDREEMSRAAAWGADAVFLSPIFPTLSHPGAAVLGPAGFRALAAAQKTPVLALGGVDAGNAGSLAGRNIVGFGAIGAFAG
ncbi:MAG: thiamine phosphate synthase [Parvularculaceae bacterium]